MTDASKGNVSTSQLEKQDKSIGALDEARQQIEGSLDTIKEILIGEHAREIHKRMNVLEERISIRAGKYSKPDST